MWKERRPCTTNQSTASVNFLPPLSPTLTLRLRRAACEQWIMNLWLLNSSSNCRQIYLISEKQSQQCMNWLPAPTVWMLIMTVFRKRRKNSFNSQHVSQTEQGQGKGTWREMCGECWERMAEEMTAWEWQEGKMEEDKNVLTGSDDKMYCLKRRG